MRRNKLRLGLLVLFFPTASLAAWTGIGLNFGDETIPIISANQALLLTPFTLSLEVEESTSQGLRIGAKLAKTGLEIEGLAQKIESASEAIGLYLYFPYEISSNFGINAKLSITKASTSLGETEVGIDFLEKKGSLGVSIKWQAIRITPTINARSIKGDYRALTNADSFSFKQQQTVYNSLNVDYFVAQNSYVRFTVTEHSEGTFNLTFTTSY